MGSALRPSRYDGGYDQDATTLDQSGRSNTSDISDPTTYSRGLPIQGQQVRQDPNLIPVDEGQYEEEYYEEDGYYEEDDGYYEEAGDGGGGYYEEADGGGSGELNDLLLMRMS